MRMSRFAGLLGVIKDLDIGSSINLESKSWVTLDSHGNQTDSRQDTSKSWTKTVDLSKYRKVHFQVTGGSGSRKVVAGSVTSSNPSTGEVVLDVSGITNRSSLAIEVFVSAAPASAAGYYPSTNVTTYNITVSKIWATAK